MTLKDRTLQIVRLNDSRSRLLAGAAALALAAGAAGLIIGRSTAPEPAAPAPQEPADKPAEAKGSEGFVPMTADRIAANGIAVEQVQAGSLASEILAQATVTAPPEGRALVTARADGAIVRIFKRLGDPVRPGETLAMLESRDAAQFVADRNAAAAKEQSAHALWQREQRLFREKITSRESLEATRATHEGTEVELRRAQAAMRAAGVVGDRYLSVRSPIAGRITEIDTQLGAFVSSGAELFNVANPNRIQIEAAVPATDAQRVMPGDPAVVELPTGGIVEAVVRSATPSVNVQSRAATVVLQLNGAPGGLRQGQALRVRITPRGGSDRGIVVPEEAVQQVEGRDVVFVQVKDGFRATPVTLGRRGAGRIEIVVGLAPGQTIAARNAFVLKAELGKGAGEEE
ncbi:MAG: efflux RND transporter periplasmic adaptor subunit [Pseudomonadota bacterium]